MNHKEAGKSLMPEWAAILSVTILAIGLRGFEPGRLGIDHFDEGIYTAAGSWSLQASGLTGLDPGLIPYSPPGYPTLVGLAYTLFGPSEFAAIAVSIIAGAATIPLIGLVGLRTFGAGGGAAAAAFAGLSGIHVVFSRMALTDATFVLIWIGAIELGGRFVERPGPWRAIALGLTVGLAQATKYNGWLLGAIVGATALLGLIVSKGDRSGGKPARTFGWGILAALIALLVSLPWFLFVERHGGYAALLGHQRSYMGEPSDWARHLMTQLHQVVALGWSRYGGSVAFALAFTGCWMTSPMTRRGWPNPGPLAAVVVAMLLFAIPTSGWWIGLAVVPWTIVDSNPRVRLMAIWWAALTALTPLYHPYARLWLPLEAAGWMMQAMVIVSLVRQIGPKMEADRSGRRVPAVAVLVALLAGSIQATSLRAGEWPLAGNIGPRDSLRVAVSRILVALPTDVTRVSLLGRPTLGYYIQRPLAARRIQSRVIERLEDLELAQSGTWAIVDSAQFHQEGGLPAGMMRLSRSWTIVAEEPTTLSSATLLDIDPGAATGDLSARTAPLLLIRRNPKG